VRNTVPGSDPKDWKRVSKFSDGLDIVRIFHSRKNSSLGVTVCEQITGGNLRAELVDLSKDGNHKAKITPVGHRRVYYVIVDLQPMGDGIALAVTDADEFDRKGCQSDHTPQIVFEELKRMGLNTAELTESVVEFWTPVTAVELKAKLDSSDVFKFSSKFHEFMKQGGGDWTVMDL